MRLGLYCFGVPGGWGWRETGSGTCQNVSCARMPNWLSFNQAGNGVLLLFGRRSQVISPWCVYIRAACQPNVAGVGVKLYTSRLPRSATGWSLSLLLGLPRHLKNSWHRRTGAIRQYVISTALHQNRNAP